MCRTCVVALRCTGYTVRYSGGSSTASEVTVQLPASARQYVIAPTDPIEYRVAVAAATRRGSGPTVSRSGLSLVLLSVVSDF